MSKKKIRKPKSVKTTDKIKLTFICSVGWYNKVQEMLDNRILKDNISLLQ